MVHCDFNYLTKDCVQNSHNLCQVNRTNHIFGDQYTAVHRHNVIKVSNHNGTRTPTQVYKLKIFLTTNANGTADANANANANAEFINPTFRTTFGNWILA
ncbi:hypothetical protein NQ318_017359 [Aromia moschata]|uniref:Uncharacterized protein n=1 Tax=Aromia moschata TaxID=1265417 RepID=A0AAV8Z4B4_9CUCU|nr:hypothetical protein NQ318_017359 [Aromia moschata]